MTEDVQELDKIPDHWTLHSALGIIEQDMRAAESTRFTYVLERGVWRLGLRRTRIGRRPGTRTLPSSISLPFVDTMTA